MGFLASRVLTIAIGHPSGGHHRRLVPGRSRAGGRRGLRVAAHASAAPAPRGRHGSPAALCPRLSGILGLSPLRAGDGSAAADGDAELARHRWHVPGPVRVQSPAWGVRRPAGVGDVAVGVAAPFVLRSMLRNAPTWRRQVAWLNIAGLVDFIGAIGTGALTSNTSLGFLASGGAGAHGGPAAQPCAHVRGAPMDYFPRDFAPPTPPEKRRGGLKLHRLGAPAEAGGDRHEHHL